MKSKIKIDPKIHTPKQIKFLKYMKQKEEYFLELMNGNDSEELEKKYNREFIAPIQINTERK